MIDDRVDEHLDLYFQQCSILVTRRDLARDGGDARQRRRQPASPASGRSTADYVRDVLSVMPTCGMYDYVGRVGVPRRAAGQERRRRRHHRGAARPARHRRLLAAARRARQQRARHPRVRGALRSASPPPARRHAPRRAGGPPPLRRAPRSASKRRRRAARRGSSTARARHRRATSCRATCSSPRPSSSCAAWRRARLGAPHRAGRPPHRPGDGVRGRPDRPAPAEVEEWAPAWWWPGPRRSAGRLSAPDAAWPAEGVFADADAASGAKTTCSRPAGSPRHRSGRCRCRGRRPARSADEALAVEAAPRPTATSRRGGPPGGRTGRPPVLPPVGGTTVRTHSAKRVGGPRRLRTFSAGTVFGESALLEHGLRTATVVAVGRRSCTRCRSPPSNAWAPTTRRSTSTCWWPWAATSRRCSSAPSPRSAPWTVDAQRLPLAAWW